MVPPFVALAARPNPGFWEYVKVNSGDLTVDEITATDYLKLKESVFDESWLVKIYIRRFSNNQSNIDLFFGNIL